MQRKEQIEAIGYIIAKRVIDGIWGAGAEDESSVDVEANAAEVNNTTGWTLEASGSMGSIIRHEGVTLSDDELAQAIQIAQGVPETAPFWVGR